MLRTGTNLFANSGLNIQTLMNFICIYLQRVLDEELNDLSDFIFDNGTLSNRTCFVQNYLGEGGVWFSYQGVGGGTGCGWGDRGWVLSHSFFVLFFVRAFVFWSLMSCLFFK